MEFEYTAISISIQVVFLLMAVTDIIDADLKFLHQQLLTVNAIVQKRALFDLLSLKLVITLLAQYTMYL